MFRVLVSGAFFRNPPYPQPRGGFRRKNVREDLRRLEQVLRGYGGALFPGREPLRRRPTNVVLDPAVNGEKLIGRRILKPELGPQCVAGNQADDEAFRARGIDMPACEFGALRRRT